jgi:hypothetical protein
VRKLGLSLFTFGWYLGGEEQVAFDLLRVDDCGYVKDSNAFFGLRNAATNEEFLALFMYVILEHIGGVEPNSLPNDHKKSMAGRARSAAEMMRRVDGLSFGEFLQKVFYHRLHPIGIMLSQWLTQAFKTEDDTKSLYSCQHFSLLLGLVMMHNLKKVNNHLQGNDQEDRRFSINSLVVHRSPIKDSLLKSFSAKMPDDPEAFFKG